MRLVPSLGFYKPVPARPNGVDASTNGDGNGLAMAGGVFVMIMQNASTNLVGEVATHHRCTSSLAPSSNPWLP